jgi:hypothetical protein
VAGVRRLAFASFVFGLTGFGIGLVSLALFALLFALDLTVCVHG